MKRTTLAAVVTGALMAVTSGCGAEADDGAASIQPTEAELLEIDKAAEAAAEQITPESANAEFEKLKAELRSK